MKKVSEMLIAISGDLLKTPDSVVEMQAHLDIAAHAWNLSILSKDKEKYELRKFIKEQEPSRPSYLSLLDLLSGMLNPISRRSAIF